MNPKKNKKLCPHCEGEIDKDAIYCLYCGTELGSQNFESPPQEQTQIPAPPYRTSARVEEKVEEHPEETQEPTLSFALLLVGSLLFVFALFLLFFSTDGQLTLKWDASYWFVYLLVAVPLFFFGLRLLKK